MKRKTTPQKTKLATLALTAALSLPIALPTAQASGIPTVDVANLSQAILEVMESMQQTATLIDSYNTQLTQLESQLRNSLAPAAYIWEQANETMSKLEAAQHLLDVYGGDLDGYLSQFKDVNWYKHSPCFTQYGCTPEERAALASVLEGMNGLQYEVNKASTDVTFKQRQAEKDNSSRERKKQIESQAQSAQGQMQALGAANQFAALQSDQLMDIKDQLNALAAVLVQQAAEQQQLKEAEIQADKRARYTGNINQPSPPKGWLP